MAGSVLVPEALPLAEPEALPDGEELEALPEGDELEALELGLDVVSVELLEAEELGGVAGGVVVEGDVVVLDVALLPLPALFLSHPAMPAVAIASTAMTGKSFFMTSPVLGALG